MKGSYKTKSSQTKSASGDKKPRGRHGDTSKNPKGRYAGGASQVKKPMGTKKC